MSKQKIELYQLFSIVHRSLSKYGLNNSDIDIVFSHLLDNEIRGYETHGFCKLRGILLTIQERGVFNPSLTTKTETPFSVLINYANQLGLVAAQRVTQIVISKARENKLCIVAIYNHVGTTGTMGYYARQIAESDLIGVVFCNSEFAVAPWGGKDAILGTNPLSIGIPSQGGSIVTDIATAAWAYGKIEAALHLRQSIPEGILLDKDGISTTNPADAADGAQLPMAGHKGYGLGLAIEILAGPLIRAKAGRDAVSGSDGFIAIALDPEMFTPLDEFKLQTGLLINEIKKSARAPGIDEILFPGERSSKLRSSFEGSKIIEISDSILEDIKILALEQG